MFKNPTLKFELKRMFKNKQIIGMLLFMNLLYMPFILQVSVFSVSSSINKIEKEAKEEIKAKIENKTDQKIEDLFEMIKFVNEPNSENTVTITKDNNSTVFEVSGDFDKGTQIINRLNYLARANNKPLFQVEDKRNNLAEKQSQQLIEGAGIVLLMILIFLSSVPIGILATDIFASEREKKTYESLMLTKTPPKKVFNGKFLTLVILTALSLSTVILALIFVILINTTLNNIQITNNAIEYQNIQITISTINNILGTSLIATIISSTILISINSIVSMRAKGYKESQFATPFITLGFGLLLGIGITLSQSFSVIKYIPILNIGLISKLQPNNYVEILVYFIGNIGVLVLFRELAKKLFNNSEKLIN